MGIANIINTAGGGGGGGSEIITNLVNSVDGAGLRLANQGYISCADVSANRFGTNDFSVEFVLSQETNAINADIFISNLNGSNQAVDAAVIRWDVIQNDNIQLVFTNSSATETAYNFGYDPAPDLNEPTHYLVSADRSGNAVLYRNGAEIASVSIAASSAANVGNSGQPTVIGSPVNNFGVKGNVYRLRTYSKALSSDEAKNVFDRADVPTALVSNLLLDLDCAYANPTQSTVIQDRGPNNQDGTLNGTITQTNVIKQLNSTSARIGTTAATPADGDIVADKVGVGRAPTQLLDVYQAGTVSNNYFEGGVKLGGSSSSLGAFLGYNSSGSGIFNLTSLNNSGGANAKLQLGFGAATDGSPDNTVMTLDQSGNVGVGVAPDANAKLDVNGTIYVRNTSVKGVISNPSSDIFDIANASGGTSNPITFSTQGSERMRISSSGATTLTASNQNVLHVNRTTSDGDCLLVEAGGSAKMRFGTLGITFPNGGYAPASAAANQLDYYEEGTWTMAWSFSTSGSATLSSTTAYYTRIGNIVTVWGGAITSGISSPSGNAQITGLPFASSNVDYCGFSIGRLSRWGTDFSYFRGMIEGQAINFEVNATNATSGTRLQGSDFSATANYNQVYFSGTYRVA